MEEKDLKGIAEQLRKPDGEVGKQVGLKMNEGNRQMNLHTLDQLNAQPYDTILEIGMGNGFFVKDIVSKDPTIKYIGCDFSATMVEEACELNKGFLSNGQVQFFLASADQLPVSNSSIDKIFTVNTIYFWQTPQRVLAEIKRILKPTGKLLIGARPKAIMESIPFTKYGFTYFTREDIETLLSANGFMVTNVSEKEEPDQEIGGAPVKLASLVVSAEVNL